MEASNETTGRYAPSWDLREAADGQWYIVLMAGNNEDVLVSETYSSKEHAQHAIETARRLTLEEAAAHLLEESLRG